MSLIITSSSQQEYDSLSKKTTGLENPASFQNFLKSPLIIEKDSEVALVSLKCSRDEDTVSIQRGDGIFVYWGAENSQNMNDGTVGSEKPTESDDINTPLKIELEQGVYSRKTFASHLQARLEDVIKKAYREVDTITVTQEFDVSNIFTGFKIQIVQIGDGSAFTDKPSSGEFKPYIDANTRFSLDDDTQFVDPDYHTDNFVASASGTDILITGNKADSTGSVADAIGKAHPLSQVNSKCVIYFNGSSAAGVVDGYTLGLVRSQGRSFNNINIDYGAVGGIGEPLTLDEIDESVKIPDAYKEPLTENPPFFWDVAFNWVPGEDGQVIHYINDNEEDDTKGIMKAVTLQTTPTNASLQAKYWEAVVFEITGEKIDVKLKQTGKEAYNTLVSSASTTFGERVKPLGQTCNQLYPKIAIHNNDPTNPGTAWLTTWNGHSVDGYYDNNYWGYTMGITEAEREEPDAMYSDCASNIDLSSVYGDGKMTDGATDYTYKGELSSNKGIDNKWVLMTGDFEAHEFDYFNFGTQKETLRDDGRLQGILGFQKSEMTQTDFGTSADSGADISFESTILPSFVPTSSLFVRLKNQALNSYNANKQSISNIIYSCPRFDAQGNTGGLLFFEPSERVYVKMNNSTELVVNSLDIDIVDVNEKIIDSLIGNTLVVLHIRKSK
jgi:hypothetical protein